MSYYCADSSGYLGDVASVGGLAAFRWWAPPEVRTFIDAGRTSDLESLAKALATPATDPGVESTRQAMLDCLKRAEDVFILTDGESN